MQASVWSPLPLLSLVLCWFLGERRRHGGSFYFKVKALFLSLAHGVKLTCPGLVGNCGVGMTEMDPCPAIGLPHPPPPPASSFCCTKVVPCRRFPVQAVRGPWSSGGNSMAGKLCRLRETDGCRAGRREVLFGSPTLLVLKRGGGGAVQISRWPHSGQGCQQVHTVASVAMGLFMPSCLSCYGQKPSKPQAHCSPQTRVNRAKCASGPLRVQ